VPENLEFLKDSRDRNGRDAHCTVDLQLLMTMGKIHRTTGV